MEKKLNQFDRLMLAVTFAEAGVALPDTEQTAGNRPRETGEPRRSTPACLRPATRARA